MVIAVLEEGRLHSRRCVQTVMPPAPVQQTPIAQRDKWRSMVRVALVEG
ncbi:MAG: hypothetical protein J4F47_10550 [Alphaproteobacteria bacterium]|nr:hypothetical protein [Alphaproteobacteria bacterium]